ncbi:hypothetical protein D9M68_799340 [compost metagenome]
MLGQRAHAVEVRLDDDRLPVAVARVLDDQAGVTCIRAELASNGGLDGGQVAHGFHSGGTGRADRVLQGVQVVRVPVLRVFDDEVGARCIAVDPGCAGITTIHVKSQVTRLSWRVELYVPFLDSDAQRTNHQAMG